MDTLMLLAQSVQVADGTTAAGTASLAMALAGLGAALGIGYIGGKAAEATGRNPGAAGPVLTIAVLGMALAEAIAIYAFVLSFIGIS